MRAQVLHTHGDIDNITFEPDWPEPEPGPGEVVLKVHTCTLNYHDVFTLRGMPGIKVPMPIIMGIDLAGEIASLGPEVEGWSVGDRVVIDPIERGRGKLQGEMMDGGLAEYVKVTAAQLVALPDGFDFAAAAALPCAYGTAYRMMMTRGQVKAGEKVLVLGASGGVGSCCVQLGNMVGAHVIAASSSDEKIEKLKALGAVEGLNYSQAGFMEQIHERFGKPRIRGEGGVDVIVNFTGGDTWVPSLRSLKKGGRILTCGATAGFDTKNDLRYIWTFEQTILGSNGWSKEDIEALIVLVQEGKLTPAIEGPFPLEETRQAFRLLERRQFFGKIAISPAMQG